MELDIFDLMEIHGYFKIDQRIFKIKNQIERIRYSFYNQTMVSYVTSNGMEIYSKGFLVENNVIPYLDTILSKERSIKMLQKKKGYFTTYLSGLEPLEKEYLIKRYRGHCLSDDVQEADIKLFEEIQEIETAINFIYGFPQDTLSVKNDTLESDFNHIANLLGV